MPYRLNPKNEREIQVKRGKRWLKKYTHRTRKEALAQLRALYANVPEAKNGR